MATRILPANTGDAPRGAAYKGADGEWRDAELLEAEATAERTTEDEARMKFEIEQRLEGLRRKEKDELQDELSKLQERDRGRFRALSLKMSDREALAQVSHERAQRQQRENQQLEQERMEDERLRKEDPEAWKRGQEEREAKSRAFFASFKDRRATNTSSERPAIPAFRQPDDPASPATEQVVRGGDVHEETVAAATRAEEEEADAMNTEAGAMEREATAEERKAAAEEKEAEAEEKVADAKEKETGGKGASGSGGSPGGGRRNTDHGGGKKPDKGGGRSNDHEDLKPVTGLRKFIFVLLFTGIVFGISAYAPNGWGAFMYAVGGMFFFAVISSMFPGFWEEFG